MITRLLPYLLLAVLTSCSKTKLFEAVDSSYSGIHFNNRITENDSINPFDIANMYNGGGVGIGDFNNDGLQDIYFTGNQVSNRLYINKGDLQFTDVTAQAHVEGEGKWSRGAAVVDINNDGWQDIYVSCSILNDPEKRKNILYISQGTDKKGIPQFKDMAAEYGLNDTTHSTMAAFFDYDNDGDLDMYLVVNVIPAGENPSVFRKTIVDGSYPSTGRLYRNDYSKTLQHPVFTNVSKEAGITIEGYGHGVTVADINRDGWQDLYVSNDFAPDNTLYINNRDGTFANKVKDYFKHTAANAMGQDIVDINNDGLQDIIELDMRPENNYRRNTMMNGNNYRIYQNTETFGYQYQYPRNVLQLNQGPRTNQHDSAGDPIFSDIGFFSGIAETDWSWAPLVADWDNDGYRDLIVTNGYPKDVTDHDFIAFRNDAYALIPKKELLEEIPQVKIHNYAYRNNGSLAFKDVSGDWGMETPSFSNGAAFADLDNDGDMDLVVNNINDEAFIYKNTCRNRADENNNKHYLSVKLRGDSLNRNGLGCWIEIHYQGKQQVYEANPYRGYLSTTQLNVHFGLGGVATVDSLVVKWPGGKKQVLRQVAADQTVEINSKNAGENRDGRQPAVLQNTLFTEITDSVGVRYRHQEKDFIDFNIQKLLPHKLSDYGPGLAAGDVDGDGLDDIIVGGCASEGLQVLLQQRDGSFIQKPVLSSTDAHSTSSNDMGIALFDADKDGDLDIYVTSGGYNFSRNTSSYQDKFYINNGKGVFATDTSVLPQNFTSKSCVRVADYDNDGDLDIFIAGRVDPWNYPRPVSSFIYRNDTKQGIIKFTDVSSSIAPSLQNVGLICDAVWTDFNGDGWKDLVLAGEWTSLKMLQNNKGAFTDITAATGISDKKGFWNSIAPGDFDNDGDMDYIAGNLGENAFLKGSDRYPVSIYAKDFDHNGVLECIPVKYIKDRQGTYREYTMHTRDDVVDQMPFIKKRFLSYKGFAETGFDKLFTPEEMKGALVLRANYFMSVFVENKGGGKFDIHPLPDRAQLAPLYGMQVHDFNNDGNLDIAVCGNDFGTEVSAGRYDALNGLVLTGDGKGNFLPLSIAQSGLFVPGNARALISLRNSTGNLLLAASQNRGALKIYTLKTAVKQLSLLPDDHGVLITLPGGKEQWYEVNYGSSFLSQSSRTVTIPDNALSFEVIGAHPRRVNLADKK